MREDGLDPAQCVGLVLFRSQAGGPNAIAPLAGTAADRLAK